MKGQAQRDEPLLQLIYRASLVILRYIHRFLFSATLPLTKHLFSRIPHSPGVLVMDRRVNRVRLKIQPNLSSPCNVEQYELQYRPAAGGGDWQSTGTASASGLVGDSTLSGLRLGEQGERTIAGLEGGAATEVRARARSHRGLSSWSPPLQVATRQWPVDGGGSGPGYSWSQSAAEVVISVQLPERLGKAGVMQLKCTLAGGKHLQVAGPPASGSSSRILLEGELHAAVHSFEDGSVWDVVSEGEGQVLTIVLEKVEAARSARLHFWPRAVIGHPEIDTHALPTLDGAHVTAAGPAGLVNGAGDSAD